MAGIVGWLVMYFAPLFIGQLRYEDMLLLAATGCQRSEDNVHFGHLGISQLSAPLFSWCIQSAADLVHLVVEVRRQCVFLRSCGVF